MTTDKINPNKNEAYDAIVTRTSVRQYLNDAPVPEVLVEALLRAAMSAPTAVSRGHLWLLTTAMCSTGLERHCPMRGCCRGHRLP